MISGTKSYTAAGNMHAPDKSSLLAVDKAMTCNIIVSCRILIIITAHPHDSVALEVQETSIL